MDLISENSQPIPGTIVEYEQVTGVMQFIRRDELGWQLDDYLGYLHSNAERFPPGAREFALAGWHYDITHVQCPHDSWLEDLTIKENSSGERKQIRIVEIRARFLGAYHNGYFDLIYEGVSSYSAIFGLIGRQGHGDWIIDEITMPNSSVVEHEIQFEGDTTWRICCADLRYHWTETRRVERRPDQRDSPFQFFIDPEVTKGVEIRPLALEFENEVYKRIRGEQFNSTISSILFQPKILDQNIKLSSDNVVYRKGGKVAFVMVGGNIKFDVWSAASLATRVDLLATNLVDSINSIPIKRLNVGDRNKILDAINQVRVLMKLRFSN